MKQETLQTLLSRYQSGFSLEQRRLYKENPDLILGKQVTIQYFEESQNQNKR